MVSLMFSAHDVAIYIINWCRKNGVTITNLKLQKLLYFVQGEYSKERESRLIKEDFYAWQLGPVIPQVYTEYSIFSSSVLPVQKTSISFCQEERDVIDHTLEKYAHRTTWALVDLTHQQVPWKYTHEIFGEKSRIPYRTIADFFESDKHI